MQHLNGSTTGILLSGGLDSSILLAKLLDDGHVVQPFYIRSHLVWDSAELQAVQRFLHAVACPRLRSLVTLELPLGDLYGEHWSITGNNTPGADSADEAVFIPGRNALLVVKAAVWCQLNGVNKLALAPLCSNPFADATGEFFSTFQRALNHGDHAPIQIIRPFETMTKARVLQLGSDYPLELTFSCISPEEELHCGNCNKCAERRDAFRAAGLTDPTQYANAICRK